MGTILYVARNMAQKVDKPLSFIMKQCAKNPTLSAELEKQVKIIIKNRKLGLGKYITTYTTGTDVKGAINFVS